MGIAEAASSGVIEYGTTEVLPGITLNMQTLYMSWLTMFIVAAIVFAATRRVQMIPYGIQNLVEMFIEWLDKLMDANLGIEGRRISTPFVITLFLYIFIGNELGMMPSIFVHLTSPTNDINVALGLSLTVAVATYIIGIIQQGPKYFKHLVSPFALMLPLNLIEELSKPLTMALRLFGNILAGEILLVVLYKLVPWVVPNLWIGFSLIIGFLQAFIFTMLTVIALAPIFKQVHHEKEK
ncbi:F0F1 ATP synthase subunit A [Acidaminococcus sp. NSJ-142]|jgi:F-type H+-transporting ATPase subunit a|uniref:F0F1 ATP synthase subunit A n=1 Tax=Acidaminococcus TaxID=904 RepID=UPI000CF88B55|nr:MULTISPECIES: F0F1 ATP synthase subunit A [Acidaminococcus]MCD2435232.1 F0F1 ATP synthase subunit A [Acidaminococcus hominis]MCH4097169.1 F0F1 ATP synthase subunit A [Acidaminococcus provencensis]RHK02074.1 ATP synthase F0 subunit A [Acidaminococcus sp. AM05-11]